MKGINMKNYLKDFLEKHYILRCIYDVSVLAWLFLCLCVTGFVVCCSLYDIFIAHERTLGSALFAGSIMLTCSFFLLRNILNRPPESTM